MAAATSANLVANAALTVEALTAANVTAVGISGAAAATLTAHTLAANAVITSTNTGGVTITQALGAGQQFVGTSSSGADNIKVGASLVANTTGDGNDTVTINASALGVGGSIDAGNGSQDKIKFNTFANAATATTTATLGGLISGFEVLELDVANGTDGATIDLDNLDAINNVIYSATNTKDSVLSNLASNGSVTISADQTLNEGLVINVKNAATGTADVLNLTLTKATALANVGVTAANVETVNITSTETAATLLGTVSHAATLSATSAKTLDIGGNAGVTLGTLTGATQLTSIDASDVTTGLVSFTTAALASAATIKGGAGTNTIVATAATKAVTYTGKDGVDTITINNAQDNVLNTAGGNDVIVVGTGSNTINAGAGDDTITVGAAAGLNTINVGSGTDTVILGGIQTAAGYYTSITGMSAGDSVNFVAVDNLANAGIANGALGAKITLGAAASFANYLNAASANTTDALIDGSLDVAIAKWFQYNGNTYIVIDQSTNATFNEGQDTVIELTGAVNLADSTFAGSVLTIV